MIPEEKAGGSIYRRGRARPVPYMVKLVVSAETGELREIEWDTFGMRLSGSLGVQRLIWAVTFMPQNLEGRSVVVPVSSVFQVSYDNHRDRSDRAETRYSNFHRYGTETVLAFER